MRPTCELCANAERTRLQQILARLNRPSPAALFLAGQAGVMRAMLGCPEPSWYEKHREAYARTGDERELARMLRHV